MCGVSRQSQFNLLFIIFKTGGEKLLFPRKTRASPRGAPHDLPGG
ncbi:hypothetical protein HMPREF1502_0133 [Klebsiella sp. AS10]|nr:hypothetical protein HMPREF1502_0133 [Klebsiella sp. AS10]